MTRDTRTMRSVMQVATSIGANESVRVAAELLTQTKMPALVVMEAGRAVGLVSSLHLVAKAIAASDEVDRTVVSDVMDATPVRISEDREVHHALLVMRERDVREVLVQDFSGRVVGIFCHCGCHNGWLDG